MTNSLPENILVLINLFTAKGHLDIYSIIHGPYTIIKVQIGLLQIYGISNPAQCCLDRTRPNDLAGLKAHGPDIPQHCSTKRAIYRVPHYGAAG